jgi:two-component system cell cycle response regulator
VRAAELAGRLHDVGKIVIPDELVTKPSELSEPEWQVMAEHAEHGFRLTRSVPGLAGVAEIIRQHHERYDGLGYPNHLRGERIRVEARIISICDSWAAMRADRRYQGTLTEQMAQEELLRGRGTQFDGNLVELFLDLWQRGLVGDLRRLRPAPELPASQPDSGAYGVAVRPPGGRHADPTPSTEPARGSAPAPRRPQSPRDPRELPDAVRR